MLRRGTMKLAIFKSKPKTPVELVRHFRHLLLFFHDNPRPRPNKRHKDKMADLSKVILEMRLVLYGFETSEPKLDACAKLTQEFFREDTFRLLIKCLPQLELGPRRDATHVIANLHRQKVNSRLIASDYMERNLDLMDILIPGYEDSEISLTYGAVARECIRHQSVARYILESNHMKKILDYIQNPSFEIASDAIETFKELLTRHKSTVAEFLSKNYNWFFQVYNTQLLQSTCYISRRQAITILGEMLSDLSNATVTARYVSSLDNMRIMMNLLMEPNKSIRMEAFHVFKLFVTNQNKPQEIYNVLVANKRKLLGFFDDFKLDKEDKNFEAAKAQIIAEIVNLRPREVACATNIVDCRIQC